jgi:hypothetical protein
MPAKTPLPLLRKIVHPRWKEQLEPVEIAARVGVAPPRRMRCCAASGSAGSTRSTAPPANRRYEHPYPGTMIHVDTQVTRQRP